MTKQTIFDVIKSDDYFVLDSETTGLGTDAEICQIAIIDSSGKVLLDTLVKPVRPIPPDATRIHGITNEMVKDAKPFDHHIVWDLLVHHNVIIYNANYDTDLLYQSENALKQENFQWMRGINFYCAMEAFAEIYGDWNDYRQSYRWQKLETACRYYKVKATDAHSALGDCLATLEVCKAMAAKQPIESAKL